MHERVRYNYSFHSNRKKLKRKDYEKRKKYKAAKVKRYCERNEEKCRERLQMRKKRIKMQNISKIRSKCSKEIQIAWKKREITRVVFYQFI